MVKANTRRDDRDENINLYLNFAQGEVARVHNWEDLEVETQVGFAQGDWSLPLPPGTIRVVSVLFNNGTLSYPVCIRPKTVVRRMFPQAVASISQARPNVAWEENRNLYWLPPSDADYTFSITSVQKSPELTLDTQECLIQGIDQALIAYATYNVFMAVQQYTDAQAWLSKYRNDLGIAIESDRNKPGREFIGQPFPEINPVGIPPWQDPFAGYPVR